MISGLKINDLKLTPKSAIKILKIVKENGVNPMGISIWQLLIILAIVLVLFGAKRLKNVGGDLGSAIKGFKSAVKDEDDKKDEDSTEKTLEQKDDDNVFDVAAEEKKTEEQKTEDKKDKV
jgi:sec-independent protein translocase protein TatA